MIGNLISCQSADHQEVAKAAVLDDERARAVIGQLLAKRLARWRAPEQPDD